MKFCLKHQTMLEELLTWRRDTRHFRPAPVPEEVRARLKHTMDLAPSVGNARPWRVFEVESPVLRHGVRREFQRCNDAAAAAYSDETRQEYRALKLAGIDVAPMQLAVFTETDPTEGRGLGRQTMPETLMQSTSMAVFCLWLAARSQNLGLGMLSIVDPQRMETLFKTPPSWRFSAYLCIGYPSFEHKEPLLHRLDWQKNTPTRWEKL